MEKAHKLILLSVILLIFGLAIEKSLAQDPTAATIAGHVKLDANLIDPLASSAISTKNAFKATFIANRDEKKVTATTKLTENLNIKISGPISKSAVDARLASLDGLANSTVLDIGLKSQGWFKPTQDKTKLDGVENIFKQSRFYQEKVKAKKRGPRKLELSEADSTGLASEGILVTGIKSLRCWNKEIDTTRIHFDKEVRMKMDSSLTDQQIERIFVYADENGGNDDIPLTYLNVKASKNTDLIEEYLDAFDFGVPVLFEARFKIGRQRYQFADTTGAALTEQQNSKTNYGFEASLGFVSEDLAYVGVSFKYDKAFQAQKAHEFITPFSNNLQTIKKIAIGEPRQKTKKRLQVEFRRVLNKYFAIKPTFTYFFDDKDEDGDKVFALDIPLYFFKDKNNGFNGGLVVSYRSDMDEFVPSFFVGNVFTIL